MADEVGKRAELMLHVAREAGALLMSELSVGRWQGQGVASKDGRELVSRVDRASEALVVGHIGDSFADDSVLAEESGLSDNAVARAGYRWIIDPLDGTTNFLHGHPMFAVSIAVQDMSDGEIAASVVHLPYCGEMFFAVRGEGAFLNSRTLRLKVSPCADLDDALVATGFAYDRARYPNYENFLRIAQRSRGIRRCGSAAVDLAYVAAGRYDAFWELGLRPWDVAAGSLLVREAGGRVSDFKGGAQWLEGGQVVAGNEPMCAALRTLLDPV